jgi:hypothetical protein
MWGIPPDNITSSLKVWVVSKDDRGANADTNTVALRNLLHVPGRRVSLPALHSRLLSPSRPFAKTEIVHIRLDGPRHLLWYRKHIRHDVTM